MFKKINTDNYELGKVQDNVDATFKRLLIDEALLGGDIVTAVIGTSDTTVNHLLGRAITGFIPVLINANAVIYQSTTNNPRPKDQIILKASSAVTAKLYFF